MKYGRNGKKGGISLWVPPAIMIVLMLSGWVLPAFGTVTEFGVKVLGIFLGMMWGWIFVDLIWPNLLGMVMLSMCGLGTATQVFSSGFGSEIVLLVIFFSVFTAWLEEIGLTNTMTHMNFGKLAAKSIPWPMVCLLAAVGPMGSALMHSDAGITKMVLGLLMPVFSGQSPMMIYILVCVICCLLTQFMNNTVLLVAMTPLMCQLAQAFDANPALVAVLMIFALSSALATPGASSRAGLVFGNAEWISTGQAYFQGIISVVCVVIALLCVGVPVGMMIL